MTNVIDTAPAKTTFGRLDYGFVYTNFLAGKIIDDSTWVVPDDLIEVDSGVDGDITFIVLEGGEPGETYTVTNQIEFGGDSPPLQEEFSFTLPIIPD